MIHEKISVKLVRYFRQKVVYKINLTLTSMYKESIIYLPPIYRGNQMSIISGKFLKCIGLKKLL